jgi:diguanylate cyclase (GGDEF)-like protein/PAS domain S-box-containing protein
MSLIARIRLAWSRPRRASDLPPNVQMILVGPLYRRIASLIVGHLAGLVLCAITMAQTGSLWAGILMVLSVILLGARGVVVIQTRRLGASPDLVSLLRWRTPYQAIGVVWSAVTSLACVGAFLVGDSDLLRVLGFVIAFGTTAGIATRNPGTPRFAITQIIIWMVPLAAAAPLLGPKYLVLSLLVVSYTLILTASIRQQYRACLDLINTVHGKDALTARFDAAVSNMTQGLLLFDADGSLRLASSRFHELLRLPAAALPPGLSEASFNAVCAGAGSPNLLIDAAAGVATRAVIDLRDGRALATSQQVLADGGRVVTIEDITEGRQAQRALVRREAELQAIFDNAATGVAELDVATNRLIRVNRVYCRMVGRTEAELLANPDPANVLHADDRRVMARGRTTILRPGQSFATNQRFLRPDGTIVQARTNVSIALMNDEGGPARLVFILQDITEQAAAQAALLESRELLRMTLDVARIGTYRRDEAAGVIHCPLETKLMHGLPTGDGPVPTSIWFSMILPEDQVCFRATMAEVHREHRSVVTLEYRYHHPTEGIRHIETRLRVLYDETGRSTGSVGVIIDVTERRAAEAMIAHLAHHDPLTGLPNRTLFRTRLEQALERARRGERFAVLCLDLDRFKAANDTFGHAIGDALLRAVTERLNAAVRPTDTVARLGGDEFAIIQTQLDNPADSGVLARRIVEAIAQPFELSGHHVVIGTSIGIAVAPDDGLEADGLLRNADTALYGAKTGGRGGHRFFESEMDTRMQAQRTLELELRDALKNQALALLYQPTISVATGAVTGFEALLRWHHPTRGLVPPDRFIPVAEAIGLMVPIGDWALRVACAEATAWPGTPRVSVNIASSQFAHKGLVDSVAAALRLSGLAPNRLELEITEATMLTDAEANLATLHRLKALGVGIAMDDFGTGYSSLSHLQRFPFDKVKIDRTFIAGLGQSRASAAVVGSVIGLCTSLDMRTTAEGVETQDQFQALAAIGCDEAQGYFLSPPLPPADVPRLIAMRYPGRRELIAAPG